MLEESAICSSFQFPSMIQNWEKNMRILYNTLEIILTCKTRLCDLVVIYHIFDEVASFEYPSNKIGVHCSQVRS